MTTFRIAWLTCYEAEVKRILNDLEPLCNLFFTGNEEKRFVNAYSILLQKLVQDGNVEQIKKLDSEGAGCWNAQK